MRYVALLLLPFIGSALTTTLKAQSCDGGGCATFTNQYPAQTFSATSSNWSLVHQSMNAGNWTLFNVTKDKMYEWTYCNEVGGSQSWDTELTLYNNSGNTLLCHQDNSGRANCPAAAYLSWTATFTGTVKLLTTMESSGSCKTNTGSPFSKLVWRETSSACTGWSIEPDSEEYTENGGDGSFFVTASTGGCSFSAISNDSWINSIAYAPNAEVLYEVDPNDGAARSGSISIKDGDNVVRATFVIDQSGEDEELTGSLEVEIDPSAARTAGAQWRVDGGTWKNSGNRVDDLSVGPHTVEFKEISGWLKPGNQIINIEADETSETVGTYTQNFGALEVSIFPTAARNAGAQWRVDGGSWKNSGVKIDHLSTGSHLVEFKEITGWSTPENETVTIEAGKTKDIEGEYVQNFGSLKVTLTPPAAVNAGARWRVKGGSWRESGYTETNLLAGQHEVQFKEINNWVEPIDISVTITMNQTSTHQAVYSQTGLPDLVVKNITADPLEAVPGDKIDVRSELHNIGNEDAKASRLYYYFSKDQTLGNDTPSGDERIASVDSEKNRSQTHKVEIPEGTSPGWWYILFEADGDKEVDESNENNNVTFQAIEVLSEQRPDLIIASANVNKSEIQIGSSIIVNLTINNTGDALCPTSEVHFFLSKESTLTQSDDSLIETAMVASIEKGKGKTLSANISIGSEFQPGFYYLLIFVDGEEQIAETNEENNVSAIPIIVNGVEQPFVLNPTDGGVSHLFWPFYNSRESVSPFNQPSKWENQIDIMKGGSPSTAWTFNNDHMENSNGIPTHHIYQDWYAQDWNFSGGNEKECGMNYYSPLPGKILLYVNDCPKTNCANKNCVVTSNGEERTCGNYLIIQYFSNGATFAFKVCHFMYLNPQLKKDSPVEVGTFLGKIGNTGNTGNNAAVHTHAALYRNLAPSDIEKLRVGSKLPTNDLEGRPYAANFNFDAVEFLEGGGEIISFVNSNESNLLLYPNPNTGEFILKHSLEGALVENITILDVNGSVLYNDDNPFVGGERAIDISHVAPGLYFVKITLNGEQKVKRFLIEN